MFLSSGAPQQSPAPPGTSTLAPATTPKNNVASHVIAGADHPVQDFVWNKEGPGGCAVRISIAFRLILYLALIAAGLGACSSDLSLRKQKYFQNGQRYF